MDYENRRTSEPSESPSSVGASGYYDIPSRSSSFSAATQSLKSFNHKTTSFFQGDSDSRARKARRVAIRNKTLSPAERDLRLLSEKASEAFALSEFDKWLARKRLVVPYVLLLMVACFSIPAVILYLEVTDRTYPEYGRWAWRISLTITFGLTVPFWLVLTQWRPAYPLNGAVAPYDYMPTVDICIASYKEDVTEIVDTIVACQRVEYPAGLIHVYLLDDGHRKELDDACEDLFRSGLLRHALTYVDRPTNEGQKAGNINHWLDKFEDESGEFFIILDADMQPFPDMLDILMGHFLGLSESERERCAFVQAPQWYRNYNGKRKWADVFNISEFFFYRVLQPANSAWGSALYVGCCALWRRQAIESVNGFIAGYATEDSVTGCQVNRTLVPGKNYRWISKFVAQPIAAGLSPETLPSLIEQRLRWYKGLCEMLDHHSWYFFASGLNPVQRCLYWVTSASFFSNILQYFNVFAGSLILLGSISYYAHIGRLRDLQTWAVWACPLAIITAFLLGMFIPGCSIVQYIHTTTSTFLYTPIYVSSCLIHYFGVTITVQKTAAEAEGGIRRWSKFFLLPLTCMTLVFATAGVATYFVITTDGERPLAAILAIPIWVAFWVYFHYHILLSLFGFSYSEIDFYQKEAVGELSDDRVKAHLRRHISPMESEFKDDDSGASDLSASFSSTENVENELRMSSKDKQRIMSNLNFFQARRRAVTETIIAETFELGDANTFSGQNGLIQEHTTNRSTFGGSAPSLPSTDSSARSVVFERKILAVVQAEAGGAGFTGDRVRVAESVF